MAEEKRGKAATRAKNKYRGENYDILYPVTAKGKKEFYKAAAGRASLSDFIVTAIEEKMKKESPELLEAMERQDAARKAAESTVMNSKVFKEIQSVVDKETPFADWGTIYREIEEAARSGVDFSGVASITDIRSRIAESGNE